VEKGFLTAKSAKDYAKYANANHWYLNLCDLGVKSLRPLRLMDFNFSTTPGV
jgi:hypothetical protein